MVVIKRKPYPKGCIPDYSRTRQPKWIALTCTQREISFPIRSTSSCEDDVMPSKSHMLRSFHTFHRTSMTSIGNKTIGATEAKLCHACMPRMGLASRSDGMRSMTSSWFRLANTTCRKPYGPPCLAELSSRCSQRMTYVCWERPHIILIIFQFIITLRSMFAIGCSLMHCPSAHILVFVPLRMSPV
jgi:hypothetical protein